MFSLRLAYLDLVATPTRSIMANSSALRFPLRFRKLVGVRVSQRFREAVEVRSATINQADIGPSDLLVRNRYAGVNASDINMTAGE